MGNFMKKALGLLLFTSSVGAAQYVDNKNIGLQERVLMRGSDYVEMCSKVVEAAKVEAMPKIDDCILYTEGLRTGYGKATTEVVMQAALFNASLTGDDWEAALGSSFYEKLKVTMTRCDLSESTPIMVQKLSSYVETKRKEADVMASIFYGFLKDQYSECR
jgi:hypothetical protein